MKTLLAVVAGLGAMSGAAWAQGQAQSPPIGVGGVAAPTVPCAGGCPNHGACCTHNRTSMTVVDAITSSGAAWKQLMMGGQRVTLSSALAAGVDVEELVRTVDVTYGPCLACACPTRPHGCGGSQYVAAAHWKIKYTRDQVAAILKDARGRELATVVSAAWSAGTVLEFTWGDALCPCDMGPQTQGPNDRPLVRGGAGTGPTNSAADGKGGKPGQEEPRPAPGLEKTDGWDHNPFELGAAAGFGGLRGRDIASDASLAIDLEFRYHSPWRGVYFVLQDVIVGGEVEFDTLTPDRFQPGLFVSVEDEERITAHAITLGVGYEHSLSADFTAFGSLGLGRYFVTGADGVNGHMIGSVEGGVAWQFAKGWEARLETSLSLGSAHVHAGEGEADLRGAWAIVLGAGVRF